MASSARRLYALAFALFAAAAACGAIAWEHTRSLAAYGPICGAAPHCPACPAALAFLAAGLATVMLAAQSARRPALAAVRR